MIARPRWPLRNWIGRPHAGTLTSLTSYDELDHVTVAEQFAYYPFVQVAGTPGAGTHPASVVVPASAASLAAFGTGQNLMFGQNRFHEAVSQELRFTSPEDQAVALDRRCVLRADRSRRDDLHQQRFRAGLRRATHQPEHRRHQSHGHLVSALPRAADTRGRGAGRARAESEQQPEPRWPTTSTAITTLRTRRSGN